MKIFYFFLFVIIGMYALVRYLEASSVFYPSKIMDVDPGRFGLHYQDIYTTTPDGVKINAWLIKQPSPKSLVLFLHGNAGNISDRLTKLKFFHEAGMEVLILDYRGFGRSQGVPSEQGVYTDARTIYDFIKAQPELKQLPLVVYGGSIGGAVAIDLAKHRPVEGLIIDSSFPSAAAMSRLIYPMIPTFFLAVKLDSASKVKTLTMPKLFMHSVDDRTVPLRMGQELFDAAPEPKEFVRLTGGHNDAHIECKDVFMGAIQSFMKKNGWL